MTSEEYVAKKGLVCPACGANAVRADGALHVDGDSAHQAIYCVKCEASWFDNYKLTGYSDLEKSE